MAPARRSPLDSRVVTARQRRRLAPLVALGAVGFLAASMGSRAGAPSGAASPAALPVPGIDKIQHIIVVVQENRSFDEYFGTYPGAKGIPRTSSGAFKVCLPDPASSHCAKPYHDRNYFDEGSAHTRDASIRDVNGGAMNGFVAEARTSRSYCVDHPRFPPCVRARPGPAGQPDVMGFHTRREIPNYWAYADHFTLQDHMFAPSDSWTLPSHLYLVSAWAARCTRWRDPMSCRSDLQADGNIWTKFDHAIYAWTDITYLLDKQGITWAYYVGKDSCVDVPCEPTGTDFTIPPQNPLPGFTDVHETGQLGNIQTHEQFFSALQNGTLPQVTWVMPSHGTSEHPPSSIGDGQAWITRVINAVGRSSAWDSSAIFLAWDDWGGFYDHVPPIRIDPNGYGIRVPGLLISPYARPGAIDHQTLSFDAYLKLIEDRFLSGQRLSRFDGRPDSRPTVRERNPALGDLATEFDFTQDPLPPLILPPRPGIG
jgi:phospholipase C